MTYNWPHEDPLTTSVHVGNALPITVFGVNTELRGWKQPLVVESPKITLVDSDSCWRSITHWLIYLVLVVSPPMLVNCPSDKHIMALTFTIRGAKGLQAPQGLNHTELVALSFIQQLVRVLDGVMTFAEGAVLSITAIL